MFPDESNLDVNVTLESERSGIVEEIPFRLLVLGDWTAEGRRKELGQRRPIEIDRDNFDDVINGLGIKLELAIGESTIDLEFNSLDDFHPDGLYERLPLFADLRDLRKRLRNSDTFNSAAREVRESLSTERDLSISAEPTAEPPPPSDDLLDAILSKPEGGAAAPKPAVSSDLSRLISDIVRPHLITVDENEQAAMVAAVDEAISSAMRSVLHNRSFQLLEAAWRGLFFLVRRTETSNDLKIYILDVSKGELASDLRSDDSIARKLLAAGQNGDPWAAVAGNYAFTPDVDDIASLIRIAKAGAVSRTPFISHMRPEILGVHSLAEDFDSGDWDLSGESDAGKLWSAMRGLPESQYLGLAMPRFLARLPYGSETEPTEAFSFEEFTDEFGHDDYLWANGCFVVAQLLAGTFSELNWQFGQQFMTDVGGLPLHMYKRDGQTVYQPCAEVQLSQNAAELLADHGIMPIVSFKNTDQVRLLRFQSISESAPTLKGRWS
ncbi:MAG: type VI secretion system contractile sheath large subunit [Pyrinomonadaceae bacterium]